MAYQLLFLAANNRLHSRKFGQKRNLLTGSIDTVHVLPRYLPNPFPMSVCYIPESPEFIFLCWHLQLSSDAYPITTLAALSTCTELEVPTDEVWWGSLQRYWLAVRKRNVKSPPLPPAGTNSKCYLSSKLLAGSGWGWDFSYDLAFTWLLNPSCPAFSTFLLVSLGALS